MRGSEEREDGGKPSHTAHDVVRDGSLATIEAGHRHLHRAAGVRGLEQQDELPHSLRGHPPVKRHVFLLLLRIALMHKLHDAPPFPFTYAPTRRLTYPSLFTHDAPPSLFTYDAPPFLFTYDAPSSLFRRAGLGSLERERHVSFGERFPCT
eukprot:228812-Prorocentrum_minimum.AAC.4